MNSNHRKQLWRRSLMRRHRTRASRRRGSTLMIVMVLMGMLSLLGVLFYTFAAQERSNSEYYSEAAKNLDDPGLSADVLMDWGLQQIIVSTDPRLKNSALWGSRHSMLSNMLGVGDHRPGDTHPYNGRGVNLIFAGNAPVVDQDRDGVADGSQTLLNWNDSPSANNLLERRLTDTTQFPQPDVGYSYPDINNIYLSYVGKVRDSNGNVHRVIIPSYHRPQYLRDASGPLPFEDADFSGAIDGTETDADGDGELDGWYSDPTTVNRLMRAHPDHVYVSSGTSSGTPPKRYFLTDADAVAKTGVASARKFPFRPMADTYDTSGGGSGPAYSSGRAGVWTHTDTNPANDHLYEFDIDLDGDGYKEAVWMDLDFPVQENASGELFVPMYAVTIVDLDSLINLNLHGHTAKTQSQSINPLTALSISSSTGSPFAGSDFLSGSNLGLTPAEVNPAWALTGRPGVDNSSSAAFGDHTDFFGGAPQDTSSLSPAGPVPTWREAANMELLWLKVGRAKIQSSSIDDIFPGVYGEEHIISQNYSPGTAPYFGYLPRPGISVTDDNGDINEGMAYTPFFGHPLDFTGLGTYLMPLSGNPQDVKRADFLTSGRSRFLRYNRYAENGNVQWGNASVGTLITNQLAFALGDDAMEVKHYAEDKSDVDDPLKAEEMLALQLNNTWLSTLTVSSRVLNLAPFNFAKDSSTNSRGEQIRRRFTTQSNDRKSYSLPYSSTRDWEYSYNAATKTFLFPPQFGTVPRYQVSATTASPVVDDPLRPAVRGMLEIEALSTKTNRWQRKLSLNQLLTYSGNQFTYRPLTPHPDPSQYPDPPGATQNLDGAALGLSYAYPPSDDKAGEFWARHDRQQLARDIYVLLYLLGHPSDAMNTATTSNASFTVYSAVKLREMAQFAVNVVDAMDRDNVITRFEYDKDLSDGWNLDDNAYATPEYSAYPSTDTTNYNENYPRDGAERGEVYGIERLDLTISESLMIHTVALTTNPSSTSYDDTTARNFAYFELRNHGPNVVNIGDKKPGQNEMKPWQVVLKQANASGTALWERRLRFLQAAGSVSVDGTFTIGSADFDRGGITPGRSNFEVDDMGGGSPARKAPGSIGVCSLDMIDPASPATMFTLEEFDPSSSTVTDRTATKGALLSAFGGASPTGDLGQPVKIQLRRRAHPTRPEVAAADEQDNPWVTVDATQFDISQFDITAGPTTASTIQGELDNLKSLERRQPLERISGSGEVVVATDQGGYIYNTFGANNSLTVAATAPTAFTLWQPHFDRDFASVMDLLYVPVFGPHRLTELALGFCRQSPRDQLTDTVPRNVAKSAAAKVMLPADPSDASGASDNRWHRLFEFIEVPTRANKNLGIGTDLAITRVPGRINLNMLRHPEVYAGLLDDSRTVSLSLTPASLTAAPTSPTTTTTLPPPYGPASALPDDPEAGIMPDLSSVFYNSTTSLYVPDSTDNSSSWDQCRDWWQQFIQSRDPIDPYWDSTASVKIPLPGLPGAKPFRSNAFLGKTGTGRPSVDDTIFRGLPLDSSQTSIRRLLEVGTRTEHSLQTSEDTNLNGVLDTGEDTDGDGRLDITIDPSIRHRLLSKIYGNTTNRSHCYAVFIAVKYFIAGEDGNAIRIGGPLNGKPEPEHRGFFVVDRSKLEKGANAGVGGYDFRAFVDYRRIIKTQ